MNFSAPTKDTSMWRRLNQRGGSLLLVIILFGFVGFNHLFAFTKLGVSLAVVDDRTLGEIRLIQFVHDHMWIPAIYFAFLVAVWMSLSLRAASVPPAWASPPRCSATPDPRHRGR